MINLKSDKKGYAGPHSSLIFSVLLSFFLFFLSTPVHSGTIELSQTGQTTCYNATGTEIACVGTGQDGDFLAGVAWPDTRFTISNFTCVIDNLTGLMWSRNAFTFAAPTTWAASVINPPTNFFACGFADWRLPNINELQSLINAEQPNNALWLGLQGFIFPLSINPIYWSSTSLADSPSVNAWNISMVDGSVVAESKSTLYLIWPVRGTSYPAPPVNTPPGQIAETGQITSVTMYDDAFFANSTPKVGVPWPDPRFIESGDCVTDNLTGLMWSKDANLATNEQTWGSALTYTNDVTVCGYVDWRLPNSKELFSLVDRSQSDPALPALHPFTNVQSGIDDLYWSSTTYADLPTSPSAWTLDMLLGGLIPLLKTEQAFVWPVRGGQTRPYVLTVRRLGDGQGKVAAPELTCVGKICTGDYSSYEVVTVTATANPGSVFTGWGGDACNGVVDTTCTITVTADMTVTATFLPEYKISVDPKSLNFKNLKQNVPATPLSVTVTNVGVADLVISSPVIAGDDPSVFGQTNDCPASLTSDAFCTIIVIATSPDYDRKAAELQIASNDPKKPTTIVRLKAKAKPPKIAKKPGSLNFGKVTVGVPIEKTLTLTNKGITDLEIPFTGVISLSGDHPADFFFTPAACPTLATGSTCELIITFTPSVAEKRSALLNIPSNDPKKQPAMTVKLKGKGE